MVMYDRTVRRPACNRFKAIANKSVLLLAESIKLVCDIQFAERAFRCFFCDPFPEFNKRDAVFDVSRFDHLLFGFVFKCFAQHNRVGHMADIRAVGFEYIAEPDGRHTIIHGDRTTFFSSVFSKGFERVRHINDIMQRDVITDMLLYFAGDLIEIDKPVHIPVIMYNRI